MSNPTFGVQYQYLSGVIDAGPLNKAQTRFLDGQDVTGMVMEAVANMARYQFGGAMTITLADGREMDIELHPPRKDNQ